jgi:hypothetical protein
MKKLLGIIIIVALASTTFHSCKKGENDPGLSLKSRTARLVGEWELTEMTSTSTNTYSTGGSSTSTTNFSGSSKTTIYSSGSVTTVYSESMEVMKDGTYKGNTSETGDGWSSISASEGTWAWIAGNKDDEYKNKERVGITETSSTNTDTYSGNSDTNIYTSDGDAGDLYIMKIDQLGSKTLVVKRDYNSNSDGDTYIISEESTYEKQ